jgi:class 3 adenylate cyclase
VDRPETRYAWNGDISLAYQVLGEGRMDLLYLQGYCSHVDMNWESPYLSRFLQGLSRHARLIITDRRGWGCSERFSPTDIPQLDTLTDDILAILDAVGSTRAAILASFECTLVALLFGASYPEKTAALILVDAIASYLWTDETPWMPTLKDLEQDVAGMRNERGTSLHADDWQDPREGDWFMRYMRASTAPGAGSAELRRWSDVDIRDVLPTIQVPTLVLSDRDGEYEVPPETGRFLADRIPGSKLVEQSSAGGIYRFHWYARGDPITEEVERFLAQLREEETSFDRVLATVLFTDIVGSTDQAAALGDREWRHLLERHHATIRALLARYRGREIDTAGDGFFASFDGPARAVRCAGALVDAVRPLGIQIRAGLHTGEVETIDDKVGGLAVAIGARVASLAGPGEVLVSSTVRDLVAGSGLAFDDAGEHELKGVPDRWRLFRVVDGSAGTGRE